MTRRKSDAEIPGFNPVHDKSKASCNGAASQLERRGLQRRVSDDEKPGFKPALTVKVLAEVDRRNGTTLL